MKKLICRIDNAISSHFWKIADSYTDRRICGRSLVKYVPSIFRDDKNGYGGTGSQSTHYALLRRVFSSVELKPNDVFLDVGCGKGRVLAFYNGPPVKTTLTKNIVNQIFPILTLAASRATPFVHAAPSRLLQQVALTGRWRPVTLPALRGGTDLILTPLHPRQSTLNRPAPHCQGRRRWALQSYQSTPLPVLHSPATHGGAGCCSPGCTARWRFSGFWVWKTH